MGNQLLKGYDIAGDPITGMGSNKMWKVFHGTRKSTNSKVTIFAIQKRTLKSSERDQIIRVAKKQATSLARIRHPGVLAINETLIQDEQVLAFSTERILGNLTTLHKQKKLKQIVSNQLELRLNLLSVLDTVQFLHENVKSVHLCLNFDNIYITAEGKWKIGGLGQSQIYSSDSLQMISDFRCDDYSFSAPEVALQDKFDRTSDIFSIGILIVNLLLVMSDSYVSQPLKTKKQYEEMFTKKLMGKVNHHEIAKLQNVQELKGLLKDILHKDPDRRGAISSITTSKWLNDRLVLTVKYLENITSYDSKQQIQFLKGLMGVLQDFNRKILLKRIFPSLIQYLKFKHLVPSILYICIEIAKDGKIINGAEFIDHIWPSLKKVTHGKEMTAHSIFMFVDNMALFEKTVSLNDVKETIVPLYMKCFDCPPKLKDLALRKTEYIMSKMDYQFIKTKMIPKIMACLKDSNEQVRKKSLIALRKTIKTLDSQTITSHVLPGLEGSRKAGTDPFINAITVYIYTELSKSLSTQIISSKLIPTILPYLIDPSVSKQDFYSYKKAMINMFEKIQAEREKYWQQHDDGNNLIYTEKDFEFEDFEKPKSTGQIGKGNFNFLSNYQTNNKSNQVNQFEQKYPRQPQTFQQEPKINFEAISQPNYGQTQPKKNIDFGALNFKQETDDFGFFQQPKSMGSFQNPKPISPQSQFQTHHRPLKGPQTKTIRPIKKEPQKQESYDPFSMMTTSNQPSTFENKTSSTSYDPFDLSSTTKTQTPISFNQQIYQPPTNQTSFGNENVFKSGNDDPFAGLEQGTNKMNMGMGANLNQGSNPQTNYGYGMNPTNQQTNTFDFNMGQGKKKDDFDLL